MDVCEIVEANPHFEFFKNGTKIRCIPTGHEMPARLEPLQAYMNCRKYKQVERNTRVDLKFDYSKYEPYITQHKKEKNQLFCQVTMRALNKVPAQVEAHVKGKLYKRKLQTYEEQMKNEDDDSEQSELLSDCEELESEEEDEEDEEEEESVAEQDDRKEARTTDVPVATNKAAAEASIENAKKKTPTQTATAAEETQKTDKKTHRKKMKTTELSEKVDKKTDEEKANEKTHGETTETAAPLSRAEKKKLKKKAQKAKYLARKKEERAQGEAASNVDEQKENRAPDAEKKEDAAPAVGEKRKKREGDESVKKPKKR